jgi:RNA polymerase sigma factor (sigma-70 family)
MPKTDLDDCVQEVWAELVTLLRVLRYDPRRGRFRTWLYTIVHSRATDLLRRRLRHPADGLGARAAALGSREGDPRSRVRAAEPGGGDAAGAGRTSPGCI